MVEKNKTKIEPQTHFFKKKMNGNVGEIKEVLAMTIEMHFERKFARDVIVHELEANSMDVLKTMKNLWIRSLSPESPLHPIPSKSFIQVDHKWFEEEDSDLVLAISVHFGGKFDSGKIVRALMEQHGDVLVTMKVLKDEFEHGAPIVMNAKL